MKPKEDEGRMHYFKRTARRLDQWTHHCKYKQIHIAILERTFAQVWSERASASNSQMYGGTMIWTFGKPSEILQLANADVRMALSMHGGVLKFTVLLYL